ncbi:hypothetical protein GKE82_26380 [Conexibacter sp. W3-3-2]|uniref:hypothetical protein n=1 Tax=Conexibacter sp. W3-3-2 TaxID=2675227 RepID=UPI0012B98B79|nr:hypothetical protein [Conexibacter sp. W3-3-2]MTD47644.1 hypothetical protein [Conexibacter sp. W3-3-2]MTD47732.1 hypothetical protein [Conexibacter sp. W3-3-2]
MEVVEVEYVEREGARAVAPFVAAVAAGVVATMVYNGGAWTISKAWDAGTRQPVTDFTRPQTVYNSATNMTYTLQPNGSYAASGIAQM